MKDKSAKQKVRQIIESALFVAENEGQICPGEYDLANSWLLLTLPNADNDASDCADACHILLKAGFSLIPGEVKI